MQSNSPTWKISQSVMIRNFKIFRHFTLEFYELHVLKKSQNKVLATNKHQGCQFYRFHMVISTTKFCWSTEYQEMSYKPFLSRTKSLYCSIKIGIFPIFLEIITFFQLSNAPPAEALWCCDEQCLESIFRFSHLLTRGLIKGLSANF